MELTKTNLNHLQHFIASLEQTKSVWNYDTLDYQELITISIDSIPIIFDLLRQQQKDDPRFPCPLLSEETEKQMEIIKEKMIIKLNQPGVQEKFWKELFYMEMTTSTKQLLLAYLEEVQQILRRKMRCQEYIIPGTEPKLELADYKQACECKQKLEQQEVLTEQEAKTLMEWLIYCARMTCDQILQKKYQATIQSDSMEDLTDYQLSSIVHSMEPLSSLSTIVDASMALPVSGHELLLMKLPVAKKVPKTLYGIDLSYRQFFIQKDCSPLTLTNGYSPLNGYYDVRNEERLTFAHQLLKEGYFEMTPTNAKLYFDPFFLRKNHQEYYDFATDQLKKPIPYQGEDYIKELKRKRYHLLLTKECLKKANFEYQFFDPDVAQKLMEQGQQYQKKE